MISKQGGLRFSLSKTEQLLVAYFKRFAEIIIFVKKILDPVQCKFAWNMFFYIKQIFFFNETRVRIYMFSIFQNLRNFPQAFCLEEVFLVTKNLSKAKRLRIFFENHSFFAFFTFLNFAEMHWDPRSRRGLTFFCFFAFFCFLGRQKQFKHENNLPKK